MRRVGRLPIGGLVIVALSLATLTAQQQPTWPMVVSTTALPAIDRGLIVDGPATPGLSRRPAFGDLQPYAAGVVVVKFKPGLSLNARSALMAMVEGAGSSVPAHANFEIIQIPQDEDPVAAARRLSAQPDVEYAQANYRAFTEFTPSDPFYSLQWNYPLLDMERAWDVNQGASSSVIVAVLDTGLAYGSELLRYQTFTSLVDGVVYPSIGTVDVPFAPASDLVGSNRIVAPRDFIWEGTKPYDLDGHGTHVAGTIGQLTNNGIGGAGMAFNVRLMPVKVLDSEWDHIFRSPSSGSDSVIAAGIRYAVDNGAKVLNMSAGRDGATSPVVRDALAYAVSRGAFVALSAGNEYRNGNPPRAYAGAAPEIEGVVAVGAIGRQRQRAVYSSTGPFVELVAPGGDMERDGPSGGIYQQTFDLAMVQTFGLGLSRYRAPRFDVIGVVPSQGTSMAAPHVAGFAALLIQQGITSPAAIEAAMKKYATDLGPAGRDDEFGYGLINPRATLRGLGLAK